MRTLLVHLTQAAVVTLLLTAAARAQSARDDIATTDPVASTQPAHAPLSEAMIEHALASLNSADSAQRAEAQLQLMGMPREQLPILHRCLEQMHRVTPSAAASLHEIVLQVYLADEPYPCNRSAGFLGLRWGDTTGLQDSPRLGVPVGLRLPGFPSYRLLQTGDLILGLLVAPDLPLQQPPNLPTPDLRDLQNAVRDAGASHEIVLEVLRQGERVRLTVTLYPGLVLPAEDVEAFTSQRRAKGESYWHDSFLPLIQPGWS